jgi:hypothetical protein
MALPRVLELALVAAWPALLSAECEPYVYADGVSDMHIEAGDSNSCASGMMLAVGESCDVKCSAGYTDYATVSSHPSGYPGDFVISCEADNANVTGAPACTPNYCTAYEVPHTDKSDLRSITGEHASLVFAHRRSTARLARNKAHYVWG